MKINPTAIQTYQQVTHRPLARPAQDQQGAESVEQRNLTITPQETTAGSELAVKAPEGTYAQYLSDAEKAALDMLFERFADSGRFGAAFTRSSDEASQGKTLGKLIDVKV